MVDRRHHVDDPVAEPDAVGSLRHGGQEDLGSGAVRVLLEKVVLDLPHVVEPQPVGQLHLRERVVHEVGFAALRPGARQLVLIEDAEPHAASILRRLAPALPRGRCTLPAVTDPLIELSARLQDAARRLRTGELEPDAAVALIEECARLATEASTEVDERARAALEPLPDLPGQLPLPAG